MTRRNRYCIQVDVEFTHPLNSESGKAAAELLASDVSQWLREIDWGYGRARVESAYAPAAQWEAGDFVPANET